LLLLFFSSSSPPRLSAPPSYNPGGLLLLLLVVVVDSEEKVSIRPNLLENPKIETIEAIFSAKIKGSNERNELLTTST
jgi:hypothetical protein